MVTHEDLLFFRHHKYAGPICSLRGILNLYKQDGIAKAELILLIENFLLTQERMLDCLVASSKDNEPDFQITKTIQEHRKIYDRCENQPKTLNETLSIIEFINQTKQTGAN